VVVVAVRPAAMLLIRADRAADERRFRQALALYDELLTRYPTTSRPARAREPRHRGAIVTPAKSWPVCAASCARASRR